MRSESINELAAALAKAQGEIRAASKDAVNPHFGKQYASLGAVWDACRGPLAKNGLCVTQTIQKNDGLDLVTTLAHGSGQWISSTFPIIVSENDKRGRNEAQALGSIITYLRRYALSAIVGVAPEDDDAESVPKTAPARAAAQVSRRTEDAPATNAKAPTQAQLARLFAIKGEMGWPDDELKQFIEMRFAKKSTKELTILEYEQTVKFIQDHPYTAKQEA